MNIKAEEESCLKKRKADTDYQSFMINPVQKKLQKFNYNVEIQQSTNSSNLTATTPKIDFDFGEEITTKKE